MVIICPECGEKTAITDGVCENCGCRIKRCAECGNIVEESCTVCDYCGAEIAQSAEPNPMETMPAATKEENNEYVKSVKAEANKLSVEAERMSKRFHWFKEILLIIGVVFVVFGLWKVIQFKSSEGIAVLAKADKVQSQARTFSVIGVIIVMLSFILDNDTVFVLPILSKKIDKSNFDYVTYLKSVKMYTEKEGMIAVVNGKKQDAFFSAEQYTKGNMLLIDALRYKKERSSFRLKYIESCITIALYLIVTVLLCRGLNANIDAHVQKVVLGKGNSFSFDFNGDLIGACVVFAVNLVFGLVFPDKEWENSVNFVQKIQNENN